MWEKSEMYKRDVLIVALIFALALSMLVGTVGWVRYRDAQKKVEEQEVMIGNFFLTIE